MSSPTWYGQGYTPATRKPGALGYVLVALRGVVLLGVLALCLTGYLAVRVIERPLAGAHRPVSGRIQRAFARISVAVMGLRVRVRGTPMAHPGALVANHSSWMDILALLCGSRVYFVSKAEVAGWPVIGWIARLMGTVFIRRDRRDAKAQTQVFRDRLDLGHRLLFFPEGTSTDGLRVLPFKTTLFAAFMADEVVDVMWVQPVTLRYHAPAGASPDHYGWWGDMGLGAHLLQVLSRLRPGGVTLVYHDAVRAADFDGRKTLARHCETAVRGPFDQAGLPPQDAAPQPSS